MMPARLPRRRRGPGPGRSRLPAAPAPGAAAVAAIQLAEPGTPSCSKAAAPKPDEPASENPKASCRNPRSRPRRRSEGGAPGPAAGAAHPEEEGHPHLKAAEASLRSVFVRMGRRPWKPRLFLEVLDFRRFGSRRWSEERGLGGPGLSEALDATCRSSSLSLRREPAPCFGLRSARLWRRIRKDAGYY